MEYVSEQQGKACERAEARPQLRSSCHVLQVAFADEACMPKHARFAHAAAPINAFEPLGEIRLQARMLPEARRWIWGFLARS